MKKPKKLEEKHLICLDNSKRTGTMDILLAWYFLKQTYLNLSRDEAKHIVTYWKKTFRERQGG